MSDQNLFAEDWINCLRAHYAHVIHEHDENNEQSLVSVLLQTGFTEQDIAAMRQEVTGEIVEAEPEMTPLLEESYQWVIEPEPQIATVTEEAYEWVVEAQAEAAPVETAEPAEAVNEASAGELADVPAVEPESSVQLDAQSDSKEDEPPSDFVQMSLF